MGQEKDRFVTTETVYVTPPGRQITVTIPARLAILPVLGAAVREYCAALPNLYVQSDQTNLAFGNLTRALPTASSGLAVRTSYSHFVYSAELILQEAATNIILHGYGKDESGAALQLELWAGTIGARQALVMELSDTAPPFDPTLAGWRDPDPHELRESGYGLYLIRKLTDDFSYYYGAGRNHLRLIKYLEL